MKRVHHSATLSNYVIGFVGSIVLTLAAYVMTTSGAFSTHVIIASVSVFALAQFILQLVFFLHLGREREQKWQLYVFSFMIVVVLILVGGSYWIMENLNYNMMRSPSEQNTYLHSQDAF